MALWPLCKFWSSKMATIKGGCSEWHNPFFIMKTDQLFLSRDCIDLLNHILYAEGVLFCFVFLKLTIKNKVRIGLKKGKVDL